VPFFPAPGTVVVVCVAGFALLELLAGLLLLLFFFFLPPFFFLDVEDVDDAGTCAADWTGTAAGVEDDMVNCD